MTHRLTDGMVTSLAPHDGHCRAIAGTRLGRCEALAGWTRRPCTNPGAVALPLEDETALVLCGPHLGWHRAGRALELPDRGVARPEPRAGQRPGSGLQGTRPGRGLRA